MIGAGKIALILAVLAVACGGPRLGVEESEPTASPDGVLMRFDDGATVAVEVVADTPSRQRGLMHRRHLDRDAGMLFLFAVEQSAEHGFWMKDTLIPLSIAYMRREGERTFEVLRVLDMEPCRKDPCRAYPSGVGYDAALEVNQGWFEDHGVRQGSAVEAEGELPTPS